MRRRAPALLALGAVSTFARGAAPCPCQGSSGAAAGVTTAFDRLGASVTETARVVHGAWLSSGAYAPLAPGSRQWALDVTGAIGVRPAPPVELSLEAAVGRQASTSPALATARTAFGDTTLRARWEAMDEPMPYEKRAVPWPAVTAVLSLRLPTAPSGRDGSESVFSGRTGGASASASSEGLGAWEPALGVALLRTFAEKWQLSLFGEGAFRFADTYLGIARHLGPRGAAQVGVRYAPTAGSGIGVLSDFGWEGNVTYRERTWADTDQRLFTVGAYGYFRAEPAKLRWGALVRYAPPFDDVSKNATRATSIAVSLGYAL